MWQPLKKDSLLVYREECGHRFELSCISDDLEPSQREAWWQADGPSIVSALCNLPMHSMQISDKRVWRQFTVYLPEIHVTGRDWLWDAASGIRQTGSTPGAGVDHCGEGCWKLTPGKVGKWLTLNNCCKTDQWSLVGNPRGRKTPGWTIGFVKYLWSHKLPFF